MTRALAILAVIQLTIVGASHIVHHRAWAEFFIQLRTLGYRGVFLHGLLCLAFGSMILAFHPLWSGLPLVLTLVGVLYVMKTVQCFVLPGMSMGSLNRVTLERSHVFIGVGVMFLVLALVMTVSLVRSGG
jgi:hypothetical protein